MSKFKQRLLIVHQRNLYLSNYSNKVIKITLMSNKDYLILNK